MSDAGSLPVLQVRRPFGWGVVLVADAETADMPLRPGSSTSTALAFAVRHAQDVEFGGLSPEDEVPRFEVSLRADVGAPTRAPVHHDVVIDVPSGTVTIGDAEAADSMVVGSGRWRVQVMLEPLELPERAEVRLSPA